MEPGAKFLFQLLYHFIGVTSAGGMAGIVPPQCDHKGVGYEAEWWGKVRRSVEILYPCFTAYAPVPPAGHFIPGSGIWSRQWHKGSLYSHSIWWQTSHKFGVSLTEGFLRLFFISLKLNQSGCKAFLVMTCQH